MKVERVSYDVMTPSAARGLPEAIYLWALLRETVNEKSSDKTASPQMSGDTLRAILSGGRYPSTLYQQTQLRIRAEKRISYGRAAIIKAYLTLKTISALLQTSALNAKSGTMLRPLKMVKRDSEYT